MQFRWKKYILAMTLLYCGQFYLCAQGPEFNKRILLDGHATILRNIVVDGDSLIISGEIGADSTGLQGVFLLKTDTLGNLGPVKFFRDPKQLDQMLFSGSDPIINNSEHIIFAGDYLWKSDHYLIDYQKNTDTFIYKEYNSSFLVRFTESLLEFEGAFYVVGYIQTQNYDLNAFIQKIDSSGNMLWEKTYGVPSRDETGRAAIVENDGLTLMISEDFDNTPLIKNDTRYWIRFMHIDTSGAIQSDWKEEVTGHEGWSGSLVKYGNDYIYTTNFLGEEFGSGYTKAAQVVRRDKDFNLVWRIPYGERDSSFYNGFGDMIISADSNLLLTGQILDTSQKYELERVLKICPDGNIICESRDTGLVIANGQSLSIMEGVVESASGAVYAVGYTYKSSGLYEGLILKVSGDGCIDTLCTIVDIEEVIKNKIDNAKVYPNPASDHITFDTNDATEERNVWLYNLQGSLMLKQNLSPGSNTIQIDKSVFPEGLYIWRVTDKKGKLINVGEVVVSR
jgi:hypothetical protein